MNGSPRTPGIRGAVVLATLRRFKKRVIRDSARYLATHIKNVRAPAGIDGLNLSVRSGRGILKLSVPVSSIAEIRVLRNRDRLASMPNHHNLIRTADSARLLMRLALQNVFRSRVCSLLVMGVSVGARSIKVARIKLSFGLPS